MLFLAKVD